MVGLPSGCGGTDTDEDIIWKVFPIICRWQRSAKFEFVKRMPNATDQRVSAVGCDREQPFVEPKSFDWYWST